MLSRLVCCQRPRNESLGMLDIENHWFAERLAYLGRSLSKDAVWRRKASNTFPCLKSDLKAECQRKLRGEAPIVRECCKALRTLPGSSDLSRLRKELYRELVVGSDSDPHGSASRWSKFARTGIGSQVRAS